MKYATQVDNETMAKAYSVSVPVSTKQCVEVCKFIKNRKYSRAVKMLEEVVSMQTPVPYTRFNRGGTGHRKGIGPGRFPVKASTYVLQLVKSAYANAKQKGLDGNSLVVKSAIAKQGPKVFRYGRKRGRIAKRTHIEVVLMQQQQQKKDATSSAAAPAAASKVQASVGTKATSSSSSPSSTKKEIKGREQKKDEGKADKK